jgi:hypothetical protein
MGAIRSVLKKSAFTHALRTGIAGPLSRVNCDRIQ